MQLILFLLVAILAYQNNTNLNLTKNQVIIVALIAYYFLFMQKEKFAPLATPSTTTPGVGPIYTSKGAIPQASLSRSFIIGTIDTNKQVQTKDPAINGGDPCVSFPTTVYREASPAPAKCRIGATGTEFSGGQAASNAANDDTHYIFNTNAPVIGSNLPA